MRIVFDTNVLLSGVATRGVCEALLQICVSTPHHTIVLSQPILKEFAKHYHKKFGMSAEQTKATLRFLRENATLVDPAAVDKDACRDPDDLIVLGTALSGKADYIVTGDYDLLTLRQFNGPPIVSPRTLYDRLSAK